MVRSGHFEYDIMWRYSIDKTMRYLEATHKYEQEDFYNHALLVYNAVHGAQRSESRDESRQRAKGWKSFIEAISPRKRSGKKKRNPLKQIAKTNKVKIYKK